MEIATHILAWFALSTYIATTAFDVWEKYRRYQNVKRIEEGGIQHPLFEDGLE
jgi:hypothetical protein